MHKCIAACLLAALGCQPQIEEIKSGCDPLDTALCALPYPSSYFLTEADTPTGWVTDYGPTSLPANRDGVQLRPDKWNGYDGFSINTRMLAFVEDLDPANLPSHTNLDASLAADSPIAVIDSTTGQRVPFWAELDASANRDDQRLLLIHPARVLDYQTTYVVGLRDLKTLSGGDIAVSEAFAALRDDERTESWDVELRRDRFDEVVFPALEDAGFARDELQLAWEFTTGSRASFLGKMEHVRDDVLAAVGTEGPAYTVDSVDDGSCIEGQAIGRTVKGSMTVPLYTDRDAAGAFLNVGADGMPFASGETTVPFTVRIPCSIVTEPAPSRIVQYGHGLLGGQSEVNGGYLSRLADANRWILFAVDWTGMKEQDVSAIMLMIVSDPSDFAFIPERSVQGMAEALAAMRMMTGNLASDAALTLDGVGVVDPSKRSYYGNSQGAILGTAYVAMSPDLDRGAFGVGGGPYSLLLSRSADFDPFFLVFKEKYIDHRKISLFVHGLLQPLWDPTEGGGWLHDLGEPAGKPVLLQVAIGDAQVTTLGAEYMARAYGASTVAPQTRPIWGIEEREPGFTGSAIVEWLYSDVPDPPVQNVPPDKDFDPHECPRREAAGQLQLRDFLETGVIEHYCDGPCVSVRADVCG